MVKDILGFGFEFMKAFKVDFSWIGIDVTVSFYELFWGSVILTILFGIFWDTLYGGKK